MKKFCSWNWFFRWFHEKKMVFFLLKSLKETAIAGEIAAIFDGKDLLEPEAEA